jgi:coproporphyrinogen III oxidase
MKDQFYSYILALQNRITQAMEDFDGKAKFKQDIWKRKEGGGGQSRIIENGAVIEKGGVNIQPFMGFYLEVFKLILKLVKLIFLLVV